MVAGDITQGNEKGDFDWYISTRNASYIKEWFEVAGNHDLNLENGKLYQKKIQKGLHYSVMKGNILFIFISDELRSSATDISDETFNWWRNLVINN